MPRADSMAPVPAAACVSAESCRRGNSWSGTQVLTMKRSAVWPGPCSGACACLLLGCSGGVFDSRALCTCGGQRMNAGGR